MLEFSDMERVPKACDPCDGGTPMEDDNTVKVWVPLGLLRQIRDTLQVCGEDLAAEVEANYPDVDRQRYPTLARRYERDMAPARQAEHLAQEVRALLDPSWMADD